MTVAASTPVPAHHGAAARAERRHDPADFRAYAQHRDPHARERLLRAHLPLANAIARRFDRGDRVPLEDLKQIAALGLIKALDRFDPDNGAAFSSFALPTIQGEIRRYFRDFSWTIRPPRELQERAVRIDRDCCEIGQILFTQGTLLSKATERITLPSGLVPRPRQQIVIQRQLSPQPARQHARG